MVLEGMKSSGLDVSASAEEVDEVVERGGIFLKAGKATQPGSIPKGQTPHKYWPEVAPIPLAANRIPRGLAADHLHLAIPSLSGLQLE